MAEFPIIPPDPTEDELAENEALATLIEALGGSVAQRDLAPWQRAKLNAAMRNVAQGRAHITDARADSKRPQRGKVPKRSARRR